MGQISILGSGCLAVSWFDRFRKPQWRPYRALVFVSLGLSGVIPVLHGLQVHGFEELDNRMAVRWVIFQGALYILGAFIYAVSPPRHLYPPRQDWLTRARSDGRSVWCRANLTSGAILIRYSTSSCCSPRPRTCMV